MDNFENYISPRRLRGIALALPLLDTRLSRRTWYFSSPALHSFVDVLEPEFKLNVNEKYLNAKKYFDAEVFWNITKDCPDFDYSISHMTEKILNDRYHISVHRRYYAATVSWYDLFEDRCDDIKDFQRLLIMERIRRNVDHYGNMYPAK